MASPNVLTVNDGNFDSEVLQSSQPVAVFYTAVWSGPCKQLRPIVDKIADEYQGKVKVTEVDIDASPKSTQKYGVRSVPTIVAFKGGQVSGSIVGLTNRDNIVKLLDVS